MESTLSRIKLELEFMVEAELEDPNKVNDLIIFLSDKTVIRWKATSKILLNRLNDLRYIIKDDELEAHLYY